jgi:hypothetical protein
MDIQGPWILPDKYSSLDSMAGGDVLLPAGATTSFARRTLLFSKYLLNLRSTNLKRIFCVDEEVDCHKKTTLSDTIFKCQKHAACFFWMA